jgi:hypothetical protein
MRNFLLFKLLFNLIAYIILFFEFRFFQNNVHIWQVTKGIFVADYFLFVNASKTVEFYKYMLDTVLFHLSNVLRNGNFYLYILVFEIKPNNTPSPLSQPYIFSFNKIFDFTSDQVLDKLQIKDFSGNRANICVMVRFLHQPHPSINC